MCVMNIIGLINVQVTRSVAKKQKRLQEKADTESDNDNSDDDSDNNDAFDKLFESVKSQSPINKDEYDEQVIDIMMHTARYRIWKHIIPKGIQNKTSLVPDVVFQDFREDPAIKELLKTHLKNLRNEMNAYFRKVFRGGIDPKTLREW